MGPMVIINLVNRLFDLYILILVLSAVISWFPNAYQSQFGQLIYKLSRPYLRYFERFKFGSIGFSVIIGVFVLQLIQRGVISLLLMLLVR